MSPSLPFLICPAYQQATNRRMCLYTPYLRHTTCFVPREPVPVRQLYFFVCCCSYATAHFSAVRRTCTVRSPVLVSSFRHVVHVSHASHAVYCICTPCITQAMCFICYLCGLHASHHTTLRKPKQGQQRCKPSLSRLVRREKMVRPLGMHTVGRVYSHTIVTAPKT